MSVETTHYVIFSRIATALDVVNETSVFVAQKIRQSLDKEKIMMPLIMLQKEIENMQQKYMLDTIDHIIKYYEDPTICLGDDAPAAIAAMAHRDYFDAVNAGNYDGGIIGLMKRIYITAAPILSVYSDQPLLWADELKAISFPYSFTSLLPSAPQEQNNDIGCDICPQCNTKMITLSDVSMYQCFDCGIGEDIGGVAFNKNQMFRNDHAKHRITTAVSPENRHFKLWMDRIQAIENKDIPQEDLEYIRACFTRDRINPKVDLTYDVMREYLRELKMTSYNEHTSLLLKIFKFESPPILCHDDYRIVMSKFILVMDLYAETSHRGIKPYYPYFIYKVIESVFADEPHKLKLLEYIHLQKESTLKKKDNIFADICKLGEDRGLNIKFKSTLSTKRR